MGWGMPVSDSEHCRGYANPQTAEFLLAGIKELRRHGEHGMKAVEERGQSLMNLLCLRHSSQDKHNQILW